MSMRGDVISEEYNKMVSSPPLHSTTRRGLFHFQHNPDIVHFTLFGQCKDSLENKQQKRKT